MWCHYCRKANHDDTQCFSTRPAGWAPKPEDREPVPPARYVVQELHAMLLEADRRAHPPLPDWLRDRYMAHAAVHALKR